MKTITLSTINNFSLQEIFEFVSNHLLKQNKKCMNVGKCAYKNNNGLKCAAGCLMSENEYDHEFENKKFSYHLIVSRFKIKKKI